MASRSLAMFERTDKSYDMAIDLSIRYGTITM